MLLANHLAVQQGGWPQSRSGRCGEDKNLLPLLLLTLRGSRYFGLLKHKDKLVCTERISEKTDKNFKT
jgi:hypothetical protein